MRGEHGHRSHTDEKREDQTVQGTLDPCKRGKEGLRGCRAKRLRFLLTSGQRLPVL